MSERDSICASEEKPRLFVCAKCKCRKSAAEFSPARGRPQSRCKLCRAAYARESRNANPYPSRQTNAKWRAKRKLAGIPILSKERKAANRKRWQAKNRHKARAHSKVHYAVKVGVLVRPTNCQRCGKAGQIEAAHTDYSKPLDVEWLCRDCHALKDFGVERVSKLATYITEWLKERA